MLGATNSNKATSDGKSLALKISQNLTPRTVLPPDRIVPIVGEVKIAIVDVFVGELPKLPELHLALISFVKPDALTVTSYTRYLPRIFYHFL